MTNKERKAVRYERRKAKREEKRKEKVSQYDTFDNITNPDNLYAAFKESRKGVGWKESIQRFEAHALSNIADLQRKLINRENIQKGFIEFDIFERGKLRHIKSIHISERVVQKVLCDEVLTPILNRSLIHDNGASIKKKGIHFAIKRLIVHLCRFYRENKSNKGYALMVDFSKFFDNIDHQILFELLEKEIEDEKVKELIRKFVTVFGDGKSLGMGSQISQIAAIFYPNKIDHYIKEKLGIKYYGRYMDDLYLIHGDKEYLKYCLCKIQEVCNELKITVNEKKTKIVPLHKGIVFLKGKYYLTENGKVLKRPVKSSALRMRRKLRKFKTLLSEGKMFYDDIRISYQSWRGSYLKRFDAYHIVKRMDNLYNELFLR